jgi:pre-rRNA-processing protein TSR1
LPEYVPCGTFVRIILASVPRDAAEAVCSGVSDYLLGHQPPLTAFGLHKHECKLSVVNMTVTRVPEYNAPVANKEEVLIVTGLRSHLSRPILSSDDYNADKHKLERFMHPGRPYVMSAYAPISFGPLPVLVLKQVHCSCCLVMWCFALCTCLLDGGGGSVCFCSILHSDGLLCLVHVTRGTRHASATTHC